MSTTTTTTTTTTATATFLSSGRLPQHERLATGISATKMPALLKADDRLTRAGKSLVTFAPRLSVFDRHNPSSNQDAFRGFYVLFWILLSFHIISTLHSNGSIFDVKLSLGRLLAQRLSEVLLIDLAMILSTFSALGFAKLLEKKYVSYSPTGVILQHAFQTVWLAFWITLVFSREWPWVQAGFLTLHSLAMLMKIHSYCATNGAMSENFWALQTKLKEIEPITLKLSDSLPHKMTSQSLISTRNRVQQSLLSLQENSHGVSLAQANDQERLQEALRLIEPLAIRPYKDQDENDQEALPEKAWPENLTILNFIDYLLIPVLVYELTYPRTRNIRMGFLIEKLLATFGTLGLIYLITQYYIWDYVPSRDHLGRTNFGYSLNDGTIMNSHSTMKLFWDIVLKLIVPFSMNYLLIFYIIFECICNFFAEVTRFADREFYSDWWNSRSFDEFSRKWNKPVHLFLLRHVYASSIASYGLTKTKAGLLTTLLSSLVHELLMYVVTRKLRLYLFLAQMTQIPLTYLGKSHFFQARPVLGNFLFWVGLLSGFPLLGVCYMLF